MNIKLWIGLALSAVLPCLAGGAKKESPPESSLDQYIADMAGQGGTGGGRSAGSLWSPSASLYDTAADIRASRPGDLVTILVFERASAVASGSSQSARSSSAKASVGALGGITKAAGPLANLARASSESELSGEGSTSRQTTLSTTLAATVSQVLPNGSLVVEGVKNLTVNSETQLITIRGIIRPVDVSTENSIRSDQIAHLEVRVNGKGIVGDAIRRPFFLYRILLGLLPF